MTSELKYLKIELHAQLIWSMSSEVQKDSAAQAPTLNPAYLWPLFLFYQGALHFGAKGDMVNIIQHDSHHVPCDVLKPGHCDNLTKLQTEMCHYCAVDVPWRAKKEIKSRSSKIHQKTEFSSVIRTPDRMHSLVFTLLRHTH